MNAFTPKATVLILLAQLLSEFERDGLVFQQTRDPEVQEWLNRMAELEYIPKREVAVVVKPEGSLPFNGAPEPVLTLMQEGQTASLSLLDAQPEQVECGAVISIPPPLSLDEE